MDPVDEIKQKLDIVDVIGTYLPVKKAGRNYKAVCPFHDDHDPSLMISPDLQIYKCFACGVSGDIFNFVQEFEGIDFYPALQQLGERAGVKIEQQEYDPANTLKKKIYETNQEAAKFYHFLLLKHKAGKKALKYLTESRGLKETTIKNFYLGYAPNSWDKLYKYLQKKKHKTEDLLKAGIIVKKRSGEGYIDKFRGRVMFPLKNISGKIVGFSGRTIFDKEPKYLNSPETPVFHKSWFLYGLDEARLEIKKSGAVFVEGQMDVLSAHQEKIKNVICVSGTSLTSNQLELLSRYTDKVTFCFDSDDAGVKASYRAVSLAEKQNLNVNLAVIPEKYEDLDDLIRKDSDLAKKTLGNPVSAYDYYLVTTFKKHNKETALGKKKILEELVPLFSKITNPVLIDHYAKEIAAELDLTEETVFSMFKKGTAQSYESAVYSESKEKEYFAIYKSDPEAYFLALLLKTEIDTINYFADKMRNSDFDNELNRNIFENLKEYISDRKTDLNIKTFVKTLDERSAELASELYLWDLERNINFDEKTEVIRELEKIKERLKKEYAKRKIKELTQELKLAEKEKNTEEVEKIVKKVKNLSEDLK